MPQRKDKLRARCERLLVSGEAVQLEGEAVCIVYGVGLPRLGFGRSFLTNRRVIWIRQTVFPLLDRLLFWLPAIETLAAQVAVCVPGARIIKPFEPLAVG